MRRLPGFLLAALVAVAASLVLALPASAAATATTTALSLDKTSIALNEAVTMTATVTAASGTASPTGTVTFQSVATSGGTTNIGTVNLVPSAPGAATATLTYSSFPAGSYQIVALYNGGFLTFSKSTSTPVQLSVAGAVIHNTTTQLTADQTTITQNEMVTFTAHVFENDGGVIVPTGTVTFYSKVGGTESLLGQADLDGSGNASLSIDGWQPGTYTIVANYVGDMFDHGSSAELTLSVNPGAAQAVDTTTAVELSPATIQTGGTVTMTATVVQSRTGAIPPAGSHVNFYGTAVGSSQQDFLGSADIVWTADGSSPASGTATLDKSGWVAGYYTITAEFVGDIYDHASSGQATLGVTSEAPTTLSYTGDTSAFAGSPANIQFQLLDESSAPVAVEPVTITVDGQTYSATSDASGNVSVSVALPAGSYPVTASFTGDAHYLASAGSGTLNVVKIPSALAYTGDTSVLAGAGATVSFVLSDSTSGNVLPNEPVSVTIDGQTQSLTTDASGAVSFTVTKPAGTYPISASFGGDAQYVGSNGSGSLVVDKIPTSTSYTGDTQGAVGHTATLSATLVDSSGNPLGGKSVTLSFGSVTCSATTNLNGVASCTVNVVDGPGSYAVTASFAGDGTYLQSSGPGTITVIGQGSTVIVDNVTGNFLLGSSLTLSGTLTVNGAPLAGKPVTLSLGTASCPATTDASGVATCAITVPGPAGTTTTKASFAGDAAFKASSDTKPALVYGLAPGGGSFVVGDKTATGSVYFWGSQWWKKNALSAGDKNDVDPASFKGYAAAPSLPQCGTSWTTLPGNSTPPPAGPLPAYMAVIVTSQNHKAPGKVITGNTVHVVIVKTNAGYAPNPGHDGTGTVVATVC